MTDSSVKVMIPPQPAEKIRTMMMEDNIAGLRPKMSLSLVMMIGSLKVCISRCTDSLSNNNEPVYVIR